MAKKLAAMGIQTIVQAACGVGMLTTIQATEPASVEVLCNQPRLNVKVASSGSFIDAWNAGLKSPTASQDQITSKFFAT